MNSQLKPQDLRYGNLIEAQGKIFTVKAIEAFIVTATRGKGNVDFTYAEVNPIPLTEEIILMAGFKHYKDDAYELKIDDNRTIQINNLDSNPHLWLKDEFSTSQKEYVFIGHPINLHQLQNVLNSLTGEELEINLK